MVDKGQSCALCGLPTGDAPIILDIAGAVHHFCCSGCARVYQIAAENGLLDQVVQGPRAKTPIPEVLKTVADAGRTVRFAVDGMWCAGCATAAERFLRAVPGVSDVDVSFAMARGRMRYDPERVDPAVVLQRLDRLGFRTRQSGGPDTAGSSRRLDRILLQTIAAAAFGMQVMVLYIALLYRLYATGQVDASETRTLQYVAWLLSTPALFYGGRSFLLGAYRALRARTATMDTLVSLGTLSAYAYSVYVTLTGSGATYFDSVTMIATFVMVGRYIELLGSTEARKDILALLTLQPALAWRRADGDWRQVNASALVAGDTILVKPGERVPADAEIVSGQAAVDQALLTGESVPVSRGPVDAIYAGTVATDGALIATVTHPPANSRLALITRVVDQTLATRPPVQRLADRASAWFAVGILAAGALAGIGWLIAGRPPAQSLLVAVSVLVVACPCALGLATPLAVAAAMGRTARAGVLVRNPAALETAAQIRRVAFDKTGTLTQGRMSVVHVAVDPGHMLTESALLSIAAAVEQYSEHPIARAIVAAHGGCCADAEGFEAQPGLGAGARVAALGGARVRLGTSSYVGATAAPELAASASTLSERGATVVWVGWGGRIAGIIALRDEPNPSASQALRRLAELGVRVSILSGDSAATTRAIAQDLGLLENDADCSPVDKAEWVRQWQAAGEKVAMVGDGVNDAPALAQADLSLTNAGGTDVAGSTSDVVLMRPDLALVPWLLTESRRTRLVIRENLAWAFAYNLVAVPLAALGRISPVIAASSMAVSSLLVVGNSLRLRR